VTLAFSPRNCLVLFQLAFFPARLQKARKPEVSTTTGFTGLNNL
jgi:hypothetical protein